MYFLSTIHHRLKIETYDKPRLYSIYYRLLGKNKDLFFYEQTTLVVEGFPRSANTFSVVVLSKFLKNSVHIAHHLHNPCQILLGIQKNIPCVVLIRKPKDAVISYAIRNNISLRMGLIDYIRFYEVLLPYISKLIVFDFKDITKSPESLVIELFQRNPSIFQKELDEKINHEEIFKRMENISKQNFNKISEIEVARPSQQRRKLKDKYIKLLANERYVDLLHRADTIYSKFQALDI